MGFIENYYPHQSLNDVLSEFMINAKTFTNGPVCFRFIKYLRWAYRNLRQFRKFSVAAEFFLPQHTVGVSYLRWHSKVFGLFFEDKRLRFSRPCLLYRKGRNKFWRGLSVLQLKIENFAVRMISIVTIIGKLFWRPRRPYLTPMDFFSWEYLTSRVYLFKRVWRAYRITFGYYLKKKSQVTVPCGIPTDFCSYKEC